MSGRDIADAGIDDRRLLVTAIAEPGGRVVQPPRRGLHHPLRDAAQRAAFAPMLARQPPVEIAPDAHAAFQVHLVVADPVAKADRLDVRGTPLVEGNELMPARRRRGNREAAIVSRHREIDGETVAKELAGEEPRVVEALDVARVEEIGHGEWIGNESVARGSEY